MTTAKKVTIEQIGSPIGRPHDAARDAQGPRPQQDRPSRPASRTRPQVRGMIAKVAHLVRVVDGH